ncbi:hypothetical protein PAXRUDRAFT_822845 [Paxillus rubicundulus Ve08.2h10]|uniref:Uncharacterized protein n=1 Tax=Paxillus rubicundulus Ve08.2h10 TaxID=930991 RepID=A0A0D0DLB3_9AGAM|nr:hypothetical protein PAXRUDRAFT_822845 [Paxillus rubicundulus Ve08.2h10]
MTLNLGWHFGLYVTCCFPAIPSINRAVSQCCAITAACKGVYRNLQWKLILFFRITAKLDDSCSVASEACLK